MIRPYEGPKSVGRAYDGWTRDGVLERYWGEHIHHGYYPKGSRGGVDFRAAKTVLIDRLLEFAGICLEEPERRFREVVDVGCGIGGSARYLARRLRAHVEGVTLSPEQVSRAEALTPDGLSARFQVADALRLPFENGRFDLVWSLESGEHMPDKTAFFDELVRVLAPGGLLLVATWCRRDDPLSTREQARLERLYQRWALPPFVPLETYREMAEDDARLRSVKVEDWSKYVRPTWPHQILLGLKDLPWLLRQGRPVLSRSLQDLGAVLDMIRGYRDGTVRYGVLAATRGDAP